MSTKEIKVGAVVKLKSGGPLMTVQSINQDGSMACIWWHNGEYKGKAFSVDVLDGGRGTMERKRTLSRDRAQFSGGFSRSRSSRRVVAYGTSISLAMARIDISGFCARSSRTLPPRSIVQTRTSNVLPLDSCSRHSGFHTIR